MRTVIVAVGVVIGCAATPRTPTPTPAPFVTPPAATWTHGAIYGVVTNAARGEPLAGVTVTAVRVSSVGSAQSAFTDETGGFSIDELSAGDYVVTYFDFDLKYEQHVAVRLRQPTRSNQVIDESKSKSKGETIEIDESSRCDGLRDERPNNRIGDGETCSMDCRQPTGICTDLCWSHGH